MDSCNHTDVESIVWALERKCKVRQNILGHLGHWGYYIISCIPEHWWVVGFIEGLKQGIYSVAHKLAGLKICGHQ